MITDAKGAHIMRRLTATALIAATALSVGAGAAFASPGSDTHPARTAATATDERGSVDRSLDRHGRDAQHHERGSPAEGSASLDR